MAHIFSLVQLRVADDNQHDLQHEPHDYAQYSQRMIIGQVLRCVFPWHLVNSMSMQAWLLGVHIYPPVFTEFTKRSYSGTPRVGASTLSVGG